MNRNIAWVWGFIFSLVLVYLAVISSSLPDHLAVHFDINGKPNGFQDRSDFIAAFLVFVCLMNGIFVGFYWLIDKMPTALVNIPWKNYWFATDERKLVAFEKLRTVMALVGTFVCSMLLLTEQVIYQANANNPAFTIPINAGLFLIFLCALFLIAACFVITKPPGQE